MPLVSKSKWGSLGVSWPDAPKRSLWSQRFRAVDAASEGMRASGQALRALRANLLTALLAGEHEIPESYDELMGEAS